MFLQLLHKTSWSGLSPSSLTNVPVSPGTVFTTTANLTVVLGVHPDHGHRLKEHLGLGVNQLTGSSVPAGPLQVESVDVDALRRGLRDVVLHPLGHLVTQHHAVQSPALIGPGYFLCKRAGGQIHKQQL